MSETTTKTFEQHIQTTLTATSQKNALDLAAFLSANNMETGDDGSHGTITWGGNILAYMHMDGKPEKPGPWTIWPSLTGNVPEGFVLSEKTTKTAHAHINVCANCGSSCAPGSRKTIFGKEFDNVCGSPLAFTDPDFATLACVKELLGMIKCAVSAQNTD